MIIKWVHVSSNFSRNASELKAADILLITVLLHNIFPHSKQAIPLTLNRTPPPLAHKVIRKGGPSVSHQIVDGSVATLSSSLGEQSSRTPVHSRPVNIKNSQNAQAEDFGYPGSVEEEFFYSPQSSPTPSDGIESAAQELPKTPATPKEHFSTPRADTPEYFKKKVNMILNCSFNLICAIDNCLIAKIINFNLLSLMVSKKRYTHRHPLDRQS